MDEGFFDPIGKLANSLREGTIWLLERLATFWVDVKTPSIGAVDKSGTYHAVGSVGWIQNQLHWLVGAAAVLGLLLAAGRMAWHRRGEPVQQALSGMFTLVVVTGCSVAVINLATLAGDQFSEEIIRSALAMKPQGDAGLDENATFEDGLKALVWRSPLFSSQSTGLLSILFTLCILSSLAQIAMLYIRFAMLGLLVGFLPLAAGMTVVPEGKAWFKKMLGWLVAFVLYKPVAACIYAFAIVSLKLQDATSQLAGIILIILAVLALPALMRFVVPMVAAAGGGGGAAMAAAGAAGAMAGRMASSGGGAGGGDASSGGGGPTGARQVGSPATPQQPPQGLSPTGGGDTPQGGRQPGGGESTQGGQQPSAPGAPGAQPAAGPGGGQPAAQGGVQATGSGAMGGAVAGAVIGAGVEAGRQVRQTAEGTAESATGQEGPDGAR